MGDLSFFHSCNVLFLKLPTFFIVECTIFKRSARIKGIESKYHLVCFIAHFSKHILHSEKPCNTTNLLGSKFNRRGVTTFLYLCLQAIFSIDTCHASKAADTCYVLKVGKYFLTQSIYAFRIR